MEHPYTYPYTMHKLFNSKTPKNVAYKKTMECAIKNGFLPHNFECVFPEIKGRRYIAMVRVEKVGKKKARELYKKHLTNKLDGRIIKVMN